MLMKQAFNFFAIRQGDVKTDRILFQYQRDFVSCAYKENRHGRIFTCLESADKLFQKKCSLQVILRRFTLENWPYITQYKKTFMPVIIQNKR